VYRQFETRHVAVAVVVVLSALLAGCGGVVPPDRVAVNTTDGYAVSDVDVWTSGGTTEYRSKVVVTGVLASADEPSHNESWVLEIPPVEVRFTLANGETRSVPASYELDRRLTDFADLGNETLSPGEGISVRAVFDPGADVTVRSATIRVHGAENASAIAPVERPQ
jgi:hypothetical protein